MQQSLLSDDEYSAAAALASLLTDMRRWVHRRVEQVEIIDDVAVVRRVSIDLTVPTDIDGIPSTALKAAGQMIVPLTFLKKERLRAFDLRRADGTPVPMLSRRDNGALATNMLVSQAEAILETALPAAMREPLHLVAEARPELAQVAFDDWQRFAHDSRHPDQRLWALLTERSGFLELGAALVDNFVVCAVTTPAANERAIFKLAYEEPFGEETRRFLAWRWKVISFDAPQAKLADSYHFEVRAPTDIDVDAGWLAFGPRERPDLTPHPDDFDFPSGQRVHLYSSGVPQDVPVKAFLFLRQRRQGNLRAAGLASALSTMLLWVFYADLHEVGTAVNSQITAGALLLGPTLLTAAVVRPGEHRLLTSLFFWVRVLTVTSLICCLVAVILLVGVAHSHREDTWLVAAIVSTMATGGLASAMALPR